MWRGSTIAVLSLSVLFQPAFSYPVGWFTPLCRGGPDIGYNLDATVKCLQAIQQNVTVEYYFYYHNDEDYNRKLFRIPRKMDTTSCRHLYRVYIDRPAVYGLYGDRRDGSIHDGSSTKDRVDECFGGGEKLYGEIDMVLKTKEYYLATDHFENFSMQTRHICGDKEQTALVGPDNSELTEFCDCCNHEFLESNRDEL